MHICNLWYIKEYNVTIMFSLIRMIIEIATNESTPVVVKSISHFDFSNELNINAI